MSADDAVAQPDVAQVVLLVDLQQLAAPQIEARDRRQQKSVAEMGQVAEDRAHCRRAALAPHEVRDALGRH